MHKFRRIIDYSDHRLFNDDPYHYKLRQSRSLSSRDFDHQPRWMAHGKNDLCKKEIPLWDTDIKSSTWCNPFCTKRSLLVTLLRKSGQFCKTDSCKTYRCTVAHKFLILIFPTWTHFLSFFITCAILGTWPL